MPSGTEFSSRMPRQDDGKVVVGVLVSIGKPTTQTIMELKQGLAINILGAAHALEKIRKLLEIKCVDPRLSILERLP